MNQLPTGAGCCPSTGLSKNWGDAPQASNFRGRYDTISHQFLSFFLGTMFSEKPIIYIWNHMDKT
jgi:hypothetical protein